MLTELKPGEREAFVVFGKYNSTYPVTIGDTRDVTIQRIQSLYGTTWQDLIEEGYTCSKIIYRKAEE